MALSDETLTNNRVSCKEGALKGFASTYRRPTAIAAFERDIQVARDEQDLEGIEIYHALRDQATRRTGTQG